MAGRAEQRGFSHNYRLIMAAWTGQRDFGHNSVRIKDGQIAMGERSTYE